MTIEVSPHRCSPLAGPEGGGGTSDQALGDMPQWDLDDLFRDTEGGDYDAAVDKAGREASSLKEDCQGKLAELATSPGALAKPIARYEALQDDLGRIASFAFLRYASDSSDSERAKFFGDMQEALTRISTDLLFFELELNRVDDALLDNALEHGDVAHYRPWLMDLRKERPYQLEDKLEELFHEKSVTGRGAWNRLFDETFSAMEFEVDGEKLTLEPTLNLLSEHDGEKRKVAAEALMAAFRDNIRLFTLITNTLAKDKEISDRWRKFADVASSRHLANRVEAEVVDALVGAVTDAYPRISHRYYAMKAKWMGMENLAHWDRNAPLPDQPDRTIAWPEARTIVLDAYGAFSPRLAEIAEPFFSKGWIDAPVRTGKRPGAFSHPTVPSAHPYIMLNYLGKPRDVMTLAHELGHGVHQVLAAGQGALMAPTPLTLAETASVFGEMLTFKSLLADAATPKERKAMLAQKVEDMINTVVRQIAFYVFERKVHTARREGELTSDKLGEIWLEVQRESLGPSVELKEGYETFWCYIPHFIHSPFYVYAYAFGDCLVNSLYAVYENAHEGFAEKYFEMLSAGGSKHHSELLAPFGLDARDPKFWAAGLGVIERMIDELEGLDT